jgi:radical SAM protein with 4Fe4S-binding SPASM domain
VELLGILGIRNNKLNLEVRLPKRVKVEYVKKDFDVNAGIDLPNVITAHEVDGRYLFIAPEKAAWITTNDIGKDILNYFKDGCSIKQTINKLKSSGLEMDIITSELRTFLIHIERKGFLESAKIKEEEPEISLQLYLTSQCNLKCIHCYMDAGKSTNDELNTDEFASLIDEFARLHKTKVAFTGGEPLVRPDIFELADRAKKNGLKVSIFTNATLIDEATVEKLKKYVDEIQFSLDGATEGVNDRIRGHGVFKKVLNAIQLLKNTGIFLRLAMLVMPQNFDDLKNNIEELAVKLDDVFIQFSLAMNEGRADNSFKFSSDSEGDKKLQEILKILYKKKIKSMNKFEPNQIVRNCGYGEIITVSSDGKIFPCAILRHQTGHVKRDNFTEIVETIRKEAMASNVEHLEICPECDLRYICFGGCRLNNLTHNRNILKPHCTPAKKKDFYKKLVVRDRFDGLAYWLGQKN